MGPEGQIAHACYIMQNGEPVARLEANNIGELTITLEGECENTGALIAGAIGSMAFEMAVKRPKEWCCGSRKRFVKLLMSYGCSRNDANEMATIVPASMGPQSYQELFFDAMARFAEYATRKDEKHGTD